MSDPSFPAWAATENRRGELFLERPGLSAPCVVAEADGVRALQAVHQAFGLGGATRHAAEGTEAPTAGAACPS
jgi:hypothetical protein